ncbi:MAG: KTSC domain-containing protein [Burkholderiales bacterium]|jgi:hypothetical protein
MDRSPVDSSNIQSIGYDPATQTLEIEFGKVDPDDPTNRVYQYRDVPPEVHEALMSDPSHGHYLYENIAFVFEYQLLGRRGDLESDD